jgi:hypothetical protein
MLLHLIDLTKLKTRNPGKEPEARFYGNEWNTYQE